MLAKRPIVRRVRYANVYISLQKCRFWRVMYMFGWGVRPREDSITKKLPFPGAFSTKMAEEEGFEPS